MSSTTNLPAEHERQHKTLAADVKPVPDVDLAKFARLQMDLAEVQASLSGVSQRANEISQYDSALRASLRPSTYWRPGDDPVKLLELPQAVRDILPDEIKIARQLVQLRAERQMLAERAEALRPRAQALTALVKACEKYVAEVCK